MSDNNFVYVVTQYDPSMSKEWVMYAFDTVQEAEAASDRCNAEDTRSLLPTYVKAVRLFKKGDKDE